MKKIFILLLLVPVFISVKACDICGWGVSNYNPFLFPHLSKNYVSLSYMHRWYQTHTDAGITGNEYYRALLIAGQFSVNKKMQLTAMVPYQVNQLINTNETKTLSGFGDMNVQVNYKLWDKLTKLNRQTIIIGGGIKLPTGIYTAAKTEDIDDQN